MSKIGILYIVPTPIGNLHDITFRAIETLKSVAIIYAEDTRNSGKLLKHFEIKSKMLSYHKFNERARVDEIIAKLKSGEDVAIISDAGTPGISDPANIIIKEAIENNFKIEALPGATAFVPAFVASGFDAERFYFVGFLPKKNSEKKELLNEIKDNFCPSIFYEAPHRLFKFLEDLKAVFGNRKVVIAREISKIYETYLYSNIDEILEKPELVKLKGEFVIVVAGFEKSSFSDAELKEELRKILESGTSKKNAINELVKKTKESKNRIYKLVIDL